MTESMNGSRLSESFDQRIKRQTMDYLRETYGWNSTSTERKSTLPYWDSKSLARVRAVGREMAKSPTVISASNKLVSFVVGNGHTYSVVPRNGGSSDKRRNASRQRRADELNLQLELTMEELGWYEHQEESYTRLIRDGEFFRRIWNPNSVDNFDLTYIEPEDVDQPTNANQVNLATVPEEVAGLFDGITPPGELGIISRPNNVRKVLGYWVKADNGKYSFISGQSVQHIKDGVDLNDPRGVPRFYWAFPHVQGIAEIDGAMRDLFLVQSKHAAVYNFEQSSMISDIKRMAHDQHVHEARDNDGKPDQPGVTYAKGFTVDLPGVNVAAREAVEIIQQEQRLVGGISDIPEHLVSEDANTGNRSSLVAAEGPFDRRVQREQITLWRKDKQIIWMLLQGMADADPDSLKTELKVVFHPPIAASRDKHKEIASEIALVEGKIKSRHQAREVLKIDNDQAEREIPEEEKKIQAMLPPPAPANNVGNGKLQPPKA